MNELIEMLSEIRFKCGHYNVRAFSVAWWLFLLGGVALGYCVMYFGYIGLCMMFA